MLDGRSARYAVNAPLLTPETARAIAPYLPLAEILGRFFAQFSRGGVRTLTLEIAGELAEYDGTPLTAAVLRGLLETSTTERVNLVNAGALAKARGHHRRRAQDARCRGVRGAADAVGRGRGGRTTSWPARSPAASRGSPGSTTTGSTWRPPTTCSSPATWTARARSGGSGIMLGEADVNISAMHLARTRPREDAFMILALDDDVPDAVAEAIRTQEAVRDLWTIRLGSER